MLRRQYADPGTFAEYLTAVRFYGVKRTADVEQLYHDAYAWTKITYAKLAFQTKELSAE